MSLPATQHTVNVAVATAPLISVLVQLPTVISACVGLAALFYYYLVITKELRSRAAERSQLKASATRVVEKINSDNK